MMGGFVDFVRSFVRLLVDLLICLFVHLFILPGPQANEATLFKSNITRVTFLVVMGGANSTKHAHSTHYPTILTTHTTPAQLASTNTTTTPPPTGKEKEGYPSYFTFRARDRFEEDITVRHMEPFYAMYY